MTPEPGLGVADIAGLRSVETEAVLCVGGGEDGFGSIESSFRDSVTVVGGGRGGDDEGGGGDSDDEAERRVDVGFIACPSVGVSFSFTSLPRFRLGCLRSGRLSSPSPSFAPRPEART